MYGVGEYLTIQVSVVMATVCYHGSVPASTTISRVAFVLTVAPGTQGGVHLEDTTVCQQPYLFHRLAVTPVSKKRLPFHLVSPTSAMNGNHF